MESLSIDIETYSDVDLQKCGVYKYASSPAFEILLFGYSIDGGAVRVVDLACGEAIPAPVLAALEDESVIKWAFNANFERVCLSRYLGLPTGDYLDSESWRCTMVWSAYMGLPLSLENAGAVLGLEEQKLKEGKDLIRYFCVPCKATKANSGRTRNLPGHDPRNGGGSKPITSGTWNPRCPYRNGCRGTLCRSPYGMSTTSTRRSTTGASPWI